jgi:hypothetical protein
VAPQTFLTDDADSEDRSVACETAIAESERCMTVPTESKLSVTDTGTDGGLKYRLHMSLEDAPLVNITDSVVCSAKDSVSVSVADVDTTDMSFINITLQKSILIPLKIQVRFFPLTHFMCKFSINISLSVSTDLIVITKILSIVHCLRLKNPQLFSGWICHIFCWKGKEGNVILYSLGPWSRNSCY